MLFFYDFVRRVGRCFFARLCAGYGTSVHATAGEVKNALQQGNSTERSHQGIAVHHASYYCHEPQTYPQHTHGIPRCPL